MIQTAADTLYPAVFGLFRDCGQVADERVTCDQELPSRIAAYVRHSSELMERINRHLTSHLANVDRVIVWGAGQLAMKLLSLPCFAQTQVRSLVDNNPVLRNKTLAGAPVVSPKEIAGTSEPIIIATLLHADEISAQIRRLGLQNPVLALLPDSTANSKSVIPVEGRRS